MQEYSLLREKGVSAALLSVNSPNCVVIVVKLSKKINQLGLVCKIMINFASCNKLIDYER